MLVHNIRKNESRVIDFRETAPSAIQEEMLQTNLDLKVDPSSRLSILHIYTVECVALPPQCSTFTIESISQSYSYHTTGS